MSRITPFEAEQMQRRVARARSPKAAAALDAAKLEKYAQGQEKRLSAEFCAFLTVNGIPHIVARTDKRSTISPGWPDVTALWDGKVACVELKADGGKVSDEQLVCHHKLHLAGIPVCVAWDLKRACDFIIKHLLQ